MDSGTNIKSLKRLLSRACAMGIACASLSFATSAYAQDTGDASATVVTPLSFISTDDLNFGQIIPSNVAGEVRMAADGTRTATNGIILVGSNQQPGAFAGQGEFFQIVSIAIGANNIQLTGPGAPMTARAFSVLSSSTANGVILNTNPTFFRIGSGTGIFAFGVGATLDVGANQTPGTYSGTWNITLEYL